MICFVREFYPHILWFLHSSIEYCILATSEVFQWLQTMLLKKMKFFVHFFDINVESNMYLPSFISKFLVVWSALFLCAIYFQSLLPTSLQICVFKSILLLHFLWFYHDNNWNALLLHISIKFRICTMRLKVKGINCNIKPF